MLKSILKSLLISINLTLVSCLPLPVPAKLPADSTVDLSVIPVQSCGVWSRNVAKVVSGPSPITGLSMWMSMWPQDARIIPLTADYISASDIMHVANPEGEANSDCIAAKRKDSEYY